MHLRRQCGIFLVVIEEYLRDMIAFQRFCFLAGGVMAVVAALPAQAEETNFSLMNMANSTDGATVQLDPEASVVEIDATGFDMSNVLSTEVDVLRDEPLAEAATEPEAEVAIGQTLDEYLAEADALSSEPVAMSAAALFSDSEAAADPATTGTQEIAQVTRPLYRGVAPVYVGIGGNIGIIDSDDSAVGDFGFNVISKISLGPRFAVRPSLQFSEDDFNVAVPVTYNFNPVDFGRFSMYPSLGAGVDIGDEIGLLLNGGIDIPISREFTLNSQLNWRVSEDAGLGVSLGVGYNFSVFFE